MSHPDLTATSHPASRFTTCALIDLDAIAANTRALAGHVGPGVAVMAVVKANAYGHGAVQTARAVLEAGARLLAVARPDEGIQLRHAGIESPILVMGYTVPAEADFFVRYDLTPTINTIEFAQALSRRAAALGRQATAHVKVDTGMGRYGLLPGEVVPFMAALKAIPGVSVEGIYTHFSSADETDQAYTRKQLAAFTAVLDALRAAGHTFPIRHAANSAAALALPETHLDAVRVGVALYGLHPSAGVPPAVPLIPALSLVSRVGRVRVLPAGSAVSYGRTYVTARPTPIALIPVGYGDGYHRALSNKGQVLIRGRRTLIVGRVCMDQIMVDVSRIEGVAQDDEVVLIGKQGKLSITAEEVAHMAGTINYEVTTALLPRLPRLYLRGGQVVEVSRPLAEGSEK